MACSPSSVRSSPGSRRKAGAVTIDPAATRTLARPASPALRSEDEVRQGACAGARQDEPRCEGACRLDSGSAVPGLEDEERSELGGARTQQCRQHPPALSVSCSTDQTQTREHPHRSPGRRRAHHPASGALRPDRCPRVGPMLLGFAASARMGGSTIPSPKSCLAHSSGTASASARTCPSRDGWTRSHPSHTGAEGHDADPEPQHGGAPAPAVQRPHHQRHRRHPRPCLGAKEWTKASQHARRKQQPGFGAQRKRPCCESEQQGGRPGIRYQRPASQRRRAREQCHGPQPSRSAGQPPSQFAHRDGTQTKCRDADETQRHDGMRSSESGPTSSARPGGRKPPSTAMQSSGPPWSPHRHRAAQAASHPSGVAATSPWSRTSSMTSAGSAARMGAGRSGKALTARVYVRTAAARHSTRAGRQHAG